MEHEAELTSPVLNAGDADRHRSDESAGARVDCGQGELCSLWVGGLCGGLGAECSGVFDAVGSNAARRGSGNCGGS